MIIEINDIVNEQKAFGHVQPLPDGVGLGKLFENYNVAGVPDLSKLLPAIVQVSVNGRQIANWQSYHPASDDRINFVIGPQWEILYYAVMIIAAIVSIVQFVMGLFASPPEASSGGRRQSDTYAFEGIRDTFHLGSPLGVTYGTHRKGGQVLMYYLTMMPENKGTRMHMLLSLGEGPVESVSEIELNDMSVTLIESVTWEIRLGTNSQAVVPGFEVARNTFYEGKEITDKQKNGLSVPNCSHVIYRTAAYDVEAIEYFVVAPQGCYKISTEGKYKNNWSKYVVEFRRSALASLSAADAPWTNWETRQLGGKEPIPTWDFGQITFPRPDQYDIRYTWRGARVQKPVGRCVYAITLADVTEVRGASGAFSGEVILAVNAAPTAKLSGGQPNVTAIVAGLKPRNYTSADSYVERWTDNPAWPMVDWMTNSRYGMGADITHDDVDIQSFLDFATLAESLAETCVKSSGEGNCPTYGTADFFDGTLWISSLDPTNTGDTAEQRFSLRSKYRGTQQSGLIYCTPCCPPDQRFGVNSSDFLNSWLEAGVYLGREIESGSPIFGLVNYVRSGTNQFSGTAYGWIANPASSTLVFCRWNSSAINTYGTVLATHSWSPHSGDFYWMAIDNNYDLPSSYGGSNTWVNYYAENGAALIDVEYVDSSASRIPFTNLDRALGAISLPTDLAGDYHSANLYSFYGETGLCYSPIGHMGSHQLNCVQNIPYYNI